MTMAESEEGVGLGWGAYVARMAGALAWLVVSALAALVAAEPGLPPAATVAAGLLIGAPAAAWLHLSLRRMKRVDEFDRSLIAIALGSGTAWAVVFGPLFVGLESILRGVSVGPADVRKLGLMLLCMQPALALLVGETMAQAARWSYARKAAA